MPEVQRHQQRPAFVVEKTAAQRKKTHHQFIPGIGYIAHDGPPELPAGVNGTKNCDPAKGTKDGSLHLLRPPNGHPPLAFEWIAAERAWESVQPERGNRLAWPADHLKRAGWEYVGPTDDRSAGRPKQEDAKPGLTARAAKAIGRG
jgi:hypothetical protein